MPVYTMDRFSKTSGGAIKLAQDLPKKHGVIVFLLSHNQLTPLSQVGSFNRKYIYRLVSSIIS
jgi:hypothetical protein